MKQMVKKIMLAVTGAGALVLGIAMVLAWWPAVVILFQGAAGITVALAGMLTLYLASRD